eukprot:3378006-Rhodomonas_salina.4
MHFVREWWLSRFDFGLCMGFAGGGECKEGVCGSRAAVAGGRRRGRRRRVLSDRRGWVLVRGGRGEGRRRR